MSQQENSLNFFDWFKIKGWFCLGICGSCDLDRNGFLPLMDFELILGQSIRDQFLDGMPDQEIEVLDVEHMKGKDYFDVLVFNRHVLQSPICFQDFSRGSLEGFVGLNQWLISQMAKCTLT